MTTPTLDLPALKALAEQATPGEWIACQMSHFERGGDLTPDELGEYVANAVRKSQATSGSSRFLFVSVMKTDGPADVCHVGNGPTSPANAAFIAAANPTTVLALLAEVERLREEHITANRRAEYWKAEHLAGNEAIAAVTAENVRLTSARDSLGQAYASASLRAGSLESALRAACDFFPSQETLDDLDDDTMSGKRYCPPVTTPRIRDLRVWRKALAEPRKGE